MYGFLYFHPSLCSSILYGIEHFSDTFMKIDNLLLFHIAEFSKCSIQTSENKITIFYVNIHMVLKTIS